MNYLLQETGHRLLQENGFGILLDETTARDTQITATPYRHPTGVAGQRRWRLYATGNPVPVREWGWVQPTTILLVRGVPVGTYAVTVQDRTSEAATPESTPYPFEVTS